MAEITTRLIFDDSQAVKALVNVDNSLNKVETNFKDVEKVSKKGMSGVAKDADKGAKAVKKFEKNTTKAAKESKGMSSATQELTGSVRILGVNVSSVITSLKAKAVALKAVTAASTTTSSAMRVLKLAIIATGIGAFVVVLGSLVAFFTKTQRGADALSKVMAGLGAAFDVVVDRVSAFGETIIKAFEDPQQALKDFGKLIVNNVINRFKGLVLLGSAVGRIIGSVLKGNFEDASKAAGDLASATTQIASGLDAVQQKKIIDGIKSVAEEINKEALAATALKDRQNALRDAQIGFIEVQAKTRRAIAENRLIAADLSKSAEERLAAIDVAIKKENELSAERQRLAQINADILTKQVALGESLAGDEQKAAQARAAVTEIETATFLAQRRLITERGALANQLAKEAADLLKVTLKKAREEFADSLTKMPGLVKDASVGIAKVVEEVDPFKDLVNVEPDIPAAVSKFQQLAKDLKTFFEGTTANEWVDAINNSLQTVARGLGGIFDAELQQQQQILEGIREENKVLEEELERQQDLRSEGLASNIQATKDALAAGLKAEEEAELKAKELRKKQLNAQLIADSAQQASGVAVAAVNFFKKGSERGPILGIALALAAIGAMFATISSVKKRASAISALYEGGPVGTAGTPWRSDRYGRGHRVEDSNLVLGGDEFVINGRTTAKQRGFLESLNAGHYDNINLASAMKDGFRKRDATIQQRSSKRNQQMLNRAMSEAMHSHSSAMIRYMAKQGQYYTYGPGDTIVHVTPTKIERTHK